MAVALKRVYLDIDEDLHSRVKEHAHTKGQTLKGFCELAIFEAMTNEQGVVKRGSKKAQHKKRRRSSRT